jgi:anti-anti-sigma regulatory factor
MKGPAMNGATTKDAAVKTSWTILPFPCASSLTGRRALRKDLLIALRVSGSPVIVDFSDCRTLNSDDIDLLLECVAQAAGRETKVLFVAGSRVNRVLLEVTRISSLVPVFNSVEEALAYPQIAAKDDFEQRRAS